MISSLKWLPLVCALSTLLNACHPYTMAIIAIDMDPRPRLHYKYSLERAEKGYPEAQVDLAQIYYEACNSPADSLAWRLPCNENSNAACSKWLHAAAENGNAKAQQKLGRFYIFGEPCEIKPDISKALYWLNKSAEQNYVPAYITLASLYEEGHFIEQNNIEATKWYLKAAENGNAYAQRKIGEETEARR